jgi:hypothetical protein
VAGAPHADVGSNANQGAAYVFDKPGGGWAGTLTQAAKLTAGDGAAYDRSGQCVTTSGHTVVAGAPSYRDNQGAAYLFQAPSAEKHGKIIVAKATDPAGDPTSFAFNGKINASLKDGERASRSVPPGTYTVQETVPPGWDLTDISCNDGNSSGDTATATATFRVREGETVRCTFTNTRRATITVQNQTAPEGATQSFTYEGAISAQLEDNESVSQEILPGTHQVTKTVPDDWTLAFIICDDDDSTSDPATHTATFRAGPGEHVTCIFASVHADAIHPPGTIVVAKETTPDGDPATFAFEGDAAGTISDGQRIIVSGLQAGTYTSRELVPRGWRLTDIECDDGVGVADRDSSGDLATATATFRLQAGELVTCTFTDRRLYDLYLPLVLR